jgi:hypothetical protein
MAEAITKGARTFATLARALDADDSLGRLPFWPSPEGAHDK